MMKVTKDLVSDVLLSLIQDGIFYYVLTCKGHKSSLEPFHERINSTHIVIS